MQACIVYRNSEGSRETTHQWAVKAWTSMHNLICLLCRSSEKRYEPGSTLFGKLVSSSGEKLFLAKVNRHRLVLVSFLQSAISLK